LLIQWFVSNASKLAGSFVKKIAVLVHRPDEIQQRFSSDSPTLHQLFEELPRGSDIVFLGDYHIDDEIYSKHKHLRRSVIPHGFFDHRLPNCSFMMNDPDVTSLSSSSSAAAAAAAAAALSSPPPTMS
jgi:hypothetical protein